MEQTVKLKLDTKEFDRGISSATKAIGALVTGVIATSIVKTTARFEDLNTTLGSVFGSAEKGSQAFAKIQSIATKTQFGVEDLSKTFVKLASSGIQPTEKLIKTFTDAAAVTTDQVGTLEAITDLFSRTVSGGLGLEELNRLADRGVPAFSILEEKLGLTRLEISEFGKTAEGARKITEALADGIEERFGGATAARMKNMSTSMSNFGIAIKNTENAIGSGFAPVFTDLLNKVTRAITENQHLAETIGMVLGAALSGVEVLVLLVADNIQILGSVAIGASVVLGAKGLSGVLTVLRVKFMLLTKTMMRNPFGLLAVAAASLITYLAMDNGLGKTFAQLSAAANVLGKAFSRLTKYLAGKMGEVIEWITDKFYKLLQGAIDMWNGIADFIPMFGRVESSAKELGGVIKKFGSESLDYVIEKAVETKDALAKVIPKEVIDTVKQLGKSITEAGNTYDVLAKKSKQARDAAGPAMPTIVAGKGISLPTVDKKALSALSDQFDSLKQSFMNESELEELEYSKKLDTLYKYYQQKGITDATYTKVREQIETKHQKNLAAIQKKEVSAQVDIFKSGQYQNLNFSKMTEEQKVDFAKQSGAAVLTELGKQNKAAFKAAKALNIANAIMNTAAGATKALAQGGIIGPILAGIVIAAGAIQIATIMGQQYQGRATGGLVQKGKPYMVGEGGKEAFIPNQTGTIIPNGNMGSGEQNVTVNFNISTVDAAGFDQLLVSRRNTITNIIRDAASQKGQRSPV